MAKPVLTGDKEIDKLLRELANEGISKAAKSAVTKGMRVVAKSQKNKVPPQYKHVKKLIGSRFNKVKKGKQAGTQQAKAGFGVGKKGKTAKKLRQSRKGRKGGGVGLSLNNIHWAVLGTEERTTKDGHPTGKMPKVLENVVPDGTQAALGEVKAKIVESLKASLEKVKR